jgi:hypothetical protein
MNELFLCRLATTRVRPGNVRVWRQHRRRCSALAGRSNAQDTNPCDGIEA